MSGGVNELQLAIVIFFFVLVTGLGFVAARWKRAKDLDNLDEWGLGGRSFGGWVTWFLLGGDLYTAYTFVAVPALVFGLGAIGFFAVPYTIVVYPIVLLAAVRMWSVAHRLGFVTPADFVRGRHGSSSLALAVAITGIVGTILSRPLLNLLRVDDPAARGFAIGLTAHAIGMAREIQAHPTAGAFAALAMGLNGIATALLMPFVIGLLREAGFL